MAHYMGRGVLAKAIVISIDKATAVRTFDKVQKHWKIALVKLRKELGAADPMDQPDLEQRLKFFEETDMAVVVSPSQNEIEEFTKKGLDIGTHRKRMVKEDLEIEFKNPEEALLNRSVAAGGYVMPPVSNDPTRYIDLSQVDFEALKEQFDKGRKPIEVQKLRAKIAVTLAQMVKMNRTRIDFVEEFQRIIDEYNAGSSNVEAFFAKLMAFAKS